MAKSCLNVGDLAKQAGMPRPTLNNVLAGKSVRPETLGLVAKGLQIDVTEILA